MPLEVICCRLQTMVNVDSADLPLPPFSAGQEQRRGIRPTAVRHGDGKHRCKHGDGVVKRLGHMAARSADRFTRQLTR